MRKGNNRFVPKYREVELYREPTVDGLAQLAVEGHRHPDFSTLFTERSEFECEVKHDLGIYPTGYFG